MATALGYGIGWGGGFVRGAPPPPVVWLDPIPVTAPETEPVTLDEAKTHSRADAGNDADDIFNLLIIACRGHVESELTRAMITQTRLCTLDCFPFEDEIELPLSPVQSVQHLKYIDTDGDEQTLSSDDYVLDTDRVGGRIYLPSGKCWPQTQHEAKVVRITFVAGYGDAADDVPANYRLRILTAISRQWADPEGMSNKVFQSDFARSIGMTDRIGF